MFEENQAVMMGMIGDIQKTVLRLASRMDMATPVNIDSYLPICSDAGMQNFLDKKDGRFNEKRGQFENYLYCHVTNNRKSKRPFETHLLAILFSREYISSHRWPGPK